jgi:hypothetical protein
VVVAIGVPKGVSNRLSVLKWLIKGIYLQACTPIRYAATKAFWATPTLFINNADKVPVDHESILAQW